MAIIFGIHLPLIHRVTAHNVFAIFNTHTAIVQLRGIFANESVATNAFKVQPGIACMLLLNFVAGSRQDLVSKIIETL